MALQDGDEYFLNIIPHGSLFGQPSAWLHHNLMAEEAGIWTTGL